MCQPWVGGRVARIGLPSWSHGHDVTWPVLSQRFTGGTDHGIDRPSSQIRQELRLERVGDALDVSADASATAAAPGPTLRAPMTGRFYVRPAPDRPAFVKADDVLEVRRTVGLLEVKKTFSRVLYEGADLPARARVLRVVPADGDDVEEGESLLELEAVD